MERLGHVPTVLGLDWAKHNCKNPEHISQKLVENASQPSSIYAVIMGTCIVQMLEEFKTYDEKIFHLEREGEMVETQKQRLYNLLVLQMKSTAALRGATDAESNSVADPWKRELPASLESTLILSMLKSPQGTDFELLLPNVLST